MRILPGNAYKVYIEVDVHFREDGVMLPTAVIWEDGCRYPVDKVLSIRPGYAAKAGGQGDKYTIQVQGRQTCIYFERQMDCSSRVIGRWFAERKIPLLQDGSDGGEMYDI